VTRFCRGSGEITWRNANAFGSNIWQEQLFKQQSKAGLCGAAARPERVVFAT